MPGPVTLSDVAREAGVSLATASRAINGSATRRVRPALRERVLAAAERLHYTADANAQAMARGRTDSLGLIVHDLEDPYSSAIATGVALAAERAGLVLTLTSTQHDPRREARLVRTLTRQRTRAIVVAGGRRDDPAAADEMRRAIEDYLRSGGSVALVGQHDFGVDTVVVANFSGAAGLARALHELGYRRFAVLAGPADHRTSRDRVAGLTKTLAGLGSPVPDTHVVHAPFLRDGGYQGMRALLRVFRDGEPAECVVAASDLLALGGIAAAREAGLVVPADIAIAGFDDIAALRDVTPGMTTVRLPLVDIGIAATELALAAPAAEPRFVHIEPTVVLRESTPPRQPWA